MKKITVVFLLIQYFIVPNIDAYSQSFDKELFEQRRQQFIEKINNEVAIFISTEVSTRNSDVDYKYRQNSDFYYLSGYDEPESAFILVPGAKHEFIMFVKEENPIMEMWVGKSCGLNCAMEKYGADTAFAIGDLDNRIYKYLRGKDVIYYNMSDDNFNEIISELINSSWSSFPDKIENPSDLLHSMRIIKSDEEIELLQKAIDITSEAYKEALNLVKPGLYEYEVKALIEYIFSKNNCDRFGFPSIVASGPNATILHYDEGNRKMSDGDLLLMDIGAEYKYYSADVTRTIPVSGKFTKEQKKLYNIVLEIQELGISMLKKDVGIDKVVRTMTEEAKSRLYEIGLITDKESNWQWRIWYFPYTCHWLGLDVHDVQGDEIMNEDGVILKPGMVTTIEPGLYINPDYLDNLDVYLRAYGLIISEEEMNSFIEKVKPNVEKYKNIGIRIEDDVLITEEGNRVLSEKAPKTVIEIEDFMNK